MNRHRARQHSTGIVCICRQYLGHTHTRIYNKRDIRPEAVLSSYS